MSLQFVSFLQHFLDLHFILQIIINILRFYKVSKKIQSTHIPICSQKYFASMCHRESSPYSHQTIHYFKNIFYKSKHF